jgi:hypothetical protein
MSGKTESREDLEKRCERYRLVLEKLAKEKPSKTPNQAYYQVMRMSAEAKGALDAVL